MGIPTGWRARRERQKAPEKAARRVGMMDTPDLVDWADGCLYAVGRSISECRNHHEEAEHQAFLDNAVAEAGVLLAVLEELQSRNSKPIKAGVFS